MRLPPLNAGHIVNDLQITNIKVIKSTNWLTSGYRYQTGRAAEHCRGDAARNERQQSLVSPFADLSTRNGRNDEYYR